MGVVVDVEVRHSPRIAMTSAGRPVIALPSFLFSPASGQVVSFVRGTLYYTPWLDLSINPKLLAMPLISILLNCMRPLGPDSDVLLLRCVFAPMPPRLAPAIEGPASCRINDAKRIHEICDAYQKGCDAEAKRKQYESTLPTIALLVKDCAIHSGVPKKGVVLTMEVGGFAGWLRCGFA